MFISFIQKSNFFMSRNHKYSSFNLRNSIIHLFDNVLSNLWKNNCCFPLCQTDWSEISRNTQQKWNDIFLLNRFNQWEWFLPLFSPFPNFLIRKKNRFVKNGTANSSQNIQTEIRGPPPEVIPNIPVRRNWKRPFYLNSYRTLWNLWHNGKRPRKRGDFVDHTKPLHTNGCKRDSGVLVQNIKRFSF